MAVILNHLDHSLVQSGFLGVDIFFVISGFVITSSLARFSREATFWGFCGSFFEKRVKRLLPTLLFCVLVTGLLICYLNPNPLTSIRTGIFSLFGLSNVFLFLKDSDYFAQSSAANVFTQTWSLSVEEQFYLLFPIMVWGSGYLKSNTGSFKLCILLCFLTVLSLVGFTFFRTSSPLATFYLMPFRLWELGIGCLSFLTLQFCERKYINKNNESMLYLLGILIILFVPSHPIISTVSVVLCTALLMISSSPETISYKVLVTPLLQFIGQISYSLYLWHWSVLSLSKWYIGKHFVLYPFYLFLIFLLAILSYFFIEKPFRLKNWSSSSSKTIGFGFLSSVLVGLSLSFFNLKHEVLLRKPIEEIMKYPDQFPLLYSGLPYNPTCVVDADKKGYNSEKFDKCTMAPIHKKGQTIWVMGDSHAGHLQGLLYSIHEKIGLGIHLIETPGVVFPVSDGNGGLRELIYEKAMSHAQQGDIILVSRLLIDRLTYAPINDRHWYSKLGDLALNLEDKGLKLIVMGPPPIFDFNDIYNCQFFVLGFKPCEISREKLLPSIYSVMQSLESALAGRKNSYIFNTFDILCPQTSLNCSPIFEKNFLYRDKDHLNTYGSRFLSTSFLKFLIRNGLLMDNDSNLKL